MKRLTLLTVVLLALIAFGSTEARADHRCRGGGISFGISFGHPGYAYAPPVYPAYQAYGCYPRYRVVPAYGCAPVRYYHAGYSRYHVPRVYHHHHYHRGHAHHHHRVRYCR